jgi:dipeptidase E
MKLFLTSAGIIPETKDFFLKLLGKTPESAKLVFVPTAANPEMDRWYLNKDKLRLAELGINNISEVDIEKENKETLSEKLKGADIIFVDGGNTFYLLKYVRESGFDVLVNDFLERGGIYVGVSAGSVIAGINIEPSGWKHADKNIVGLKDLAGMKLVPFAITPHYGDEFTLSVKEAVEGVTYPVVALTDKQAVVVDGDNMEIVGQLDKSVFNYSGTL